MEKTPTQESLFHRLVQRWFKERIGPPTSIQEKAWPLIASGRHLLITAPTGSGKTLCAFLWALNQLISGNWETGVTQVLYVSPLKALNNDIHKNLIRPLTQLRELFQHENAFFPAIRVMTRSGDTPSSQRREMIRNPPEILITTPESLHLMLSSQGGLSILGRIRTVIMDEIHAVVGNKRGTLLISAADRLVPLCGEFQRISLSATVNSPQTVADFVGGYRIEGALSDPIFRKRSVEHCDSLSVRSFLIDIHLAETVLTGQHTRSVWEDMADEFSRTIVTNRSTIIFVNSRRLCEKLTFLINSDRKEPIAYSHHGSLSKELRLDVEQRLKNGRLKAIVATSSLELGIDIGSLEHVILVQSPPSVSSAIQRIGRAGHAVGGTSKATFFPTHALDAVNAAVLAKAVLDKEIEPVSPVRCPLDVLAQIIISMIGTSTWDMDELYSTIRSFYPFHDLQRMAYDLVIEMLAGRYASTRIASLRPKLALDKVENTLTARKGALLSLYTSGGVIPDRGYFALRHQGTGARIGELDEEFVWEAKKGQVFTLGTQNWKIDRITHNDVFVRPANPKTPAPPFWRAEDVSRDFHLSQKIGCFLETAQGHMEEQESAKQLMTGLGLKSDCALFLFDFFKRQQEKTGCPLPHRHHVVVETMPPQKGDESVCQVVIHTFWGGRVNRPFALAIEEAWEKRYGYAPRIFPTNDALYLLLPDETDKGGLMTLVQADAVDSLVRQRLEGSGIFGARFRECAARALLLPRNNFNQRMPLWLTRQKSQQLLETLGTFSDFPILLETWRTCLSDDFDMDSLKRVLLEMENGDIRWSEVHTLSPSPMSLSGSWRMINQYMYAEDRQQGKVKTDLSDDLIRQVVYSPELRPKVSVGVIDRFTEKRQRLYPGYAPDTALEILEWVKERIIISFDEWEALMVRSQKESGISQQDLLAPLAGKLLRIFPVSPSAPDNGLIVATELATSIACGFYKNRKGLRWTTLEGKPVRIANVLDERQDHAGQYLGQWLRCYGPVTKGFIGNCLHIENDHLSELLSGLMETQSIISGMLVRGKKDETICDAENFESLLRISRHRKKPTIKPRKLTTLPSVLAHFQKMMPAGESIESLVDCMQRLMGYPLPGQLWETEVLPARLMDYNPQWMDRLIQETGLMWMGRESRKVVFCHEQDLDLFEAGPDENSDIRLTKEKRLDAISSLFPGSRGRYTLADLSINASKSPKELRQLLWKGVWEGLVLNDSMAALRQEIGKGYTKRQPDGGRNLTFPGSRSSFRKRSYRRFPMHGEPSAGTWRRFVRPDQPSGMIETEELGKERVRLLLDRYGILFRQLLARELPVLQWSSIFRSLRLMELSGEVVCGYFFEDISGLQFASKKMLGVLQKKQSDTCSDPPKDCVFWINAQDPISICGLGVDALKGKMPRRLAGTHLVYLGNRLALVSQQSAKKLSIYLLSDHLRLPDCLCVFDHLLGRKIAPLSYLTLETINGKNAVDSPYLAVFKKKFDVVPEEKSITLYRAISNGADHG